MRGVYSVEQLRAAEAQAMGHLSAGALMDRAATGLANECVRFLRARGRVYGSQVGLLVGSGSNGGDALYAGERLIAQGMQVAAVLLHPERVHQAGLDAFIAAGGRIATAPSELVNCALLVDAIVGLGGRGGLRPAAAAALTALQGIPIVSVDLPSGVDPDTGEVSGAAVTADLTVTFGALKTGLLIGAGARHTGELRLVDLGLRLPEPQVRVLEEADVAALLPTPAALDDKYSRGVVGIIAGSPQYPGAGVLATGAAGHGGAGMVRYLGGAPELIHQRFPAVVVQTDTPCAQAKVQAWVVGSGMGLGGQARSQLQQALATDVPVLVDADALTMLADDPSLLAQREAPTILTPHDREFARIANAPGPDRLAAARAVAAALHATVLLKGNRTIIASPSGNAFINTTGTPWLATAGSGDVLAGLVGALLATGLDTLHAGAVGAFLHGLAGQFAADGGNPDAHDLLHALPRAVATVRGHRT